MPGLDERSSSERPAVGDGIELIAACNGGRLHSGAGGDRLVGVGHRDRRRRQIGAALAIGGRTRPPPTRKILPSTVAPTSRSASRPCSRPHNTPSCAASASCSRDVALVRPETRPVESGRFGVRSPSKYGMNVTDPGSAAAASASSAHPAASVPSHRPTESVTLVALSVHTSGRYEPLALAKPATAPDSSRRGCGGHREHRAGRPQRDRHVAAAEPEPERAAPMLSPLPAATSTSPPRPSSATRGCNQPCRRPPSRPAPAAARRSRAAPRRVRSDWR